MWRCYRLRKARCGVGRPAFPKPAAQPCCPPRHPPRPRRARRGRERRAARGPAHTRHPGHPQARRRPRICWVWQGVVGKHCKGNKMQRGGAKGGAKWDALPAPCTPAPASCLGGPRHHHCLAVAAAAALLRLQARTHEYGDCFLDPAALPLDKIKVGLAWPAEGSLRFSPVHRRMAALPCPHTSPCHPPLLTCWPCSPRPHAGRCCAGDGHAGPGGRQHRRRHARGSGGGA